MRPHAPPFRRALRSLCLVPLFLASAVRADDLYWANPLGGDWLLGSNWSAGVVPTATDWAYLGYDHGGTTFANPSALTASFVDGSIFAYGVRSRMNLSLGGVTNDSTLYLDAGGLSVESGAALYLHRNSHVKFTAGSNFEGRVVADARATLEGGGTISNTSVIAATSGADLFVGNGVWTNHGDFEAASSVDNAIIQAQVTGIDAGHHAWATGRGVISLSSDGGSIVNAGEMRATDGGSIGIYGLSLSNEGAISGSGGSSVGVQAGNSWSNTGSIVVDGAGANGQATRGYISTTTAVITPDTLGDVRGTNGGKLYFNGIMDATGTALDGSRFGADGTMNLGGTVTGSILNSQYLVASGTWNGVSVDHGIRADGMTIKNGISLGDGPLSLTGYYGATFDGDQTFHGPISTVPIPGSTSGLIIDGALTLGQDASIDVSSGYINLRDSPGSILNKGLIRATGDNTQYGAISGIVTSFENALDGRIETDGRGGFINLKAQDFVNHGNVRATNGGYVALGGQVNGNPGNGAFHNDGAILADGSWTDPNGVVNPSYVQILGNYKVADLGDVRGTNGGKVRLGGVLDNSGTSLEVDRFGAPGTLNLVGTVKGGTLGNAAHLTDGNIATLDGVSVPGGLGIMGDSRFEIKNGIDLGDGVISVDSGYITFTGAQTFDGTINVRTGLNGSNYLQTLNGASLGEASQVNVLAGTNLYGYIQTAGSINIAEGASLHAYVVQTGGHVRIDGSFDAPIDVRGGRLTGRGYADSVKNGALVQPGNSVGTLHVGSYTQTDAGALEMEIASATSFDVLEAQSLVLDGTLKIDLLDPSLASGTDLYRLVTYGGTLTGTFSSLSAPAGWSIVYGDHFVGVQASPVPEPASLAALGLGALAVLRRRRLCGAS